MGGGEDEVEWDVGEPWDRGDEPGRGAGEENAD